MSNWTIWENVFRWAFMVIGALLFVIGFAWGRWDATTLGLLFIQFSIAISLALSKNK